MASVPIYKSKVTQLATPRQTAGGTNTSGFIASAQANQSLAQKLDMFSSQLNNMAGQSAQTQAAKDATLDIYKRKQKISDINNNDTLSPEQKNTEISKIAEGTEARFSGVYSRAYNNAANAAYSTQIQRDAKEASDQAELASNGDSEAYAKQMKEFKDGTIPNAPTKETAIVAELAINQYGSAGYKKLKMAEIRRDEQRRQTLNTDTVRIQSEDIANNLQEGDFVSASQNIFKLKVSLEDRVKNGWGNKEEAQLQIDKATENGILSYARDRFARGEVLDGQDFIDKFRKGDPSSEVPSDFFNIDRNKVADRMEYLLETEQKNLDLKAKADEAYTKEQANIVVGDGIKVFNAFKIPENINDIEQALPYASLAKQHEYKVQLAAYDLVRPYMKLSLPEQQAVLNSKVSDKSMSRIEVEALSTVKKNLAERVKKSQQDSMGLSFEEGLNSQKVVMTPQADLMLQAQGLKERAYMQTKNKEEYGKGATNLFTQQEAEQYSQWLNSPDTSIASKLDFFTMLEESIPNKSNSVYNQIMKKGANVAAFAGSMLKEGKRDVAERVFKGQVVLKALDKPEEISEMRYKILKALGNSTVNMGGDVTGSSLEAIIDTGLALYGAELQEQGRFDKGASSSQMKKIIKDLTNGVHERNGQSFFLPMGTNEDNFDDWIDNLKPGDIPAAKGLTEEQTIKIIQQGRINSYGPNKYSIYQGKSNLKNLDGTTYTISVP